MSKTHQVWLLGDNIDTDVLAPGHAMKYGIDQMKQYCLESVLPEFAAQVRPGDVIVAGSGFGIGSSREQAASVLVALGVHAVIAPDFGGLFFRNAFNVGLLLITCDLRGAVQAGDRIQLQVPTERPPTLIDAHGRPHTGEPIPDFLLRRVACGGLLPELKLKMKEAHV